MITIRIFDQGKIKKTNLHTSDFFFFFLQLLLVPPRFFTDAKGGINVWLDWPTLPLLSSTCLWSDKSDTENQELHIQRVHTDVDGNRQKDTTFQKEHFHGLSLVIRRCWWSSHRTLKHFVKTIPNAKPFQGFNMFPTAAAVFVYP